MLIETMPGRMQAAVMIGTEGPGLNSPDYIAFSVMNTILGRGIGSRLGHYVRDDQGLAYAVGSWLHALEDIGFFTSFLSTRADYTEQAIESVISQIELISEEHVMDIELKLVQSNAVGSHALSTMSYDGQASYLVNIFINERPLDYDRIRLGKTLELSPEHLLETAAEYFGPGEWFISVAGGVDENLNPVFE